MQILRSICVFLLFYDVDELLLLQLVDVHKLDELVFDELDELLFYLNDVEY